MAKWSWSKYNFIKTWQKHPHIARYGYILHDERGFARGHITYFTTTKKYVAYCPSKKWGAWDDEKLGEFDYLTDAKRKVESYWGKKITRSRRSKSENDYGIKGDWRPFEGM